MPWVKRCNRDHSTWQNRRILLGVTITVTGKLPRLGGQMAPDHDRVLYEIEVIPAKIAGFREAQPMAIDQ
jgi:hypothetical protein